MSDRADQAAGGLSRRDLMRNATYVGVGGTGALLLNACGGSSSTTKSATGRRGGELNMTLVGLQSTDSLDPSLGHSAFGGILGLNVYGLLTMVDSLGTLEMDLAEKAVPDRQARTWTFTLRDARFSDGSPLTADDVVFTFQRILDPKTGSLLMSQVEALVGPDDIVAVGPKTVEFRLKVPNADFPAFLAQGNLAIVKKGTTAWEPGKALGAGPFMVKSFVPGESFEFVRNPHYHMSGLPRLDSIRATAANDSALALQAVMSGSADLAGSVEVSALQELRSSSGTKIVPIKNAQWCYIVMDSTTSPWDDPNVVEALKSAVDRKQLTEQVFRGQGDLTTDIKVPSASPYFPPSLPIREQDLEKAKELLARSGHSDGVKAELYTTSAYAGMIDYASAFKQMVAPAGFDISIQQADPSTYFSGTPSGVWLQKPFYVSYSVTRPPSQLIPRNYTSDSPSNEAKLKDPQVDALWRKASATVDDKARLALYHEIFLLVADRISNSISSSVNGLYASKSNLEGLVTDPVSTFRLRGAYLA